MTPEMQAIIDSYTNGQYKQMVELIDAYHDAYYIFLEDLRYHLIDRLYLDRATIYENITHTYAKIKYMQADDDTQPEPHPIQQYGWIEPLVIEALEELQADATRRANRAYALVDQAKWEEADMKMRSAAQAIKLIKDHADS